MSLARLSLVLLVAACTSTAGEHAPRANVAAARERELIAESEAARSSSDYPTARTKAAEAVAALIARPESERDAEWLGLVDAAGHSAYSASDVRTANTAWQRVLELRSQALPDDDPELQAVRANLALTLQALGDLAGARSLQEHVLAILSRTRSDDHPDVQVARVNLATTLCSLGDLDGARALFQAALDVDVRTLPDDHPDLQIVRGNLAVTIKGLGDLVGARTLEQKVLEVDTRTLPDDHPGLQRARGNLASTIRELGDLEGARTLAEKVLDVDTRTLPEDHPDLQTARQSLAITLFTLGDLDGARALQERAFEVLSRTLPDDHPELQSARGNLAVTISALGDLAGARALNEKVLEVLSRTYPADHPDLQRARGNLAATLYELGDLQGARVLFETVLEVNSRSLPDDHPALQGSRQNLAATLWALGDLAGARALEEQVLDFRSRTLPDDHPDLMAARQNLAITLGALGEFAAARALQEQVLDVRVRTLPDDHPDLQAARHNLAVAIANQAAYDGRPSFEARRACVELMGAACSARIRAARTAILGSPSREAEERCVSLAQGLDLVLSFASGYGVFEPSPELEAPAFEFEETTRGAALAAAEFAHCGARTPEYSRLRGELLAASDELALLAQEGATSEALDRARVKREAAERDLVALARESAAGRELGVDALAAVLAEREAAVAFRCFTELGVDPSGAPDLRETRETAVERVCAFVVRSATAGAAESAQLLRIDLGPLDRVEAAARGWRDAIGVGAERGLATGTGEDEARTRGEQLRGLVFDPLLTALGGADRVVVVLDGVLHLVALDALPLANSNALVGDRWRIETRATLTELLTDSPAATAGALVALGGASFNSAPILLSAEDVAAIDDEAAARGAALSRATKWERDFTPLTHTGDEARGIGALYTEIFEGARPALVLEKRKASREALLELAPRARFLHVATHGWYAPESIRSWSDPEPLDEKSGLGTRMSGGEQVRGMSPMLLCGLALAGANLPEDAVGRAPGLITADELSTLDLSNCELAVLSACDTNVGERRAGQGVASLQKALQMAGARSVITSLWKVPDEATKELMLDFYRRLWVEKKPKWQALWEAKQKLRDAKDASGRPKYTTRDWAAWVLTGNPI
ncbi:MAG: tetratricopeptide repeat protein [Planctomycetes bacterium]|nr:tetratricopeptide repeat protein [Planctomycetota bacterium]